MPQRLRFRNLVDCWCLVLMALVLTGTPRGLIAQESVQSLRARAAAGHAAEALETIRAMVALETATFEHLELGTRLAIQAGDLRAAFGLVGKMRAMAPDDPRADTWEGHVTIQQARGARVLRTATLADAAIHYRDARKKGGDAYQNGYWEADAWYQAGRFEDTLQAAQAALEARPADRSARVLHARALLDLSRGSEAAADAQDLWKRFRGDAEIARLLLEARVQGGDPDACAKTFADLLEVLPRDVKLYEILFQGLRERGPVAMSALKSILDAAAKSHPEESYPLFYQASVAALERRYEDALALYQRYRGMRPRDGAGHLYVGSLLTRLGRLVEARKALIRASELGNVEAGVLAHHLRLLVAAFVGKNDWSHAGALQKLVVALSGDASDSLDLQTLQIAAGDGAAAMQTLKGLLEREDVDFRTRARVENNLALLHQGAGRTSEALAAFDRALDWDDECWDALENKGVLLIALGRPDEARKVLSAVIAGREEGTTRRARYHLLRIRHARLLEGR